MTVQGDACGIDSMSRSLGGRAQSAQGRANGFARAAGTISPLAFRGGKADQARQFAMQMQAASNRTADAYDKVASFLPRVSRAVAEAQRADKALDRANLELTRAQLEVVQARSALAQAKMAATSPLGLATPAFGGLPGVTRSPAQQAAIHAAEERLRRAEADESKAARAQKKAQHTFDEAERDRTSTMRAFSSLANGLSAQLRGSVPMTPLPLMGSAPFGPAGLQQSQLTIQADGLAALAKMINKYGSKNVSPAEVRTALATRNGYALEGLLPQPKPKKHGESLLHKLGKIPIPVVAPLGMNTNIEVFKGAVDGTKSLAVSTYNTGGMVFRSVNVFNDAQRHKQWAQNRAIVEAIKKDPGGTMKNMLNLDLLRKNPARWVGTLAPDVAATLASGGAGAVTRAARVEETAAIAERSAVLADSTASASKLVQAQHRAAVARQTLRDAERVETRIDRINENVGRAGTGDFLASNQQDIDGCSPYQGQLGPRVFEGGEGAVRHVGGIR